MADSLALAVGLTVLALLGVERLVELALNRRHVAWLRAQGARFLDRDGFGLLLAGQVLMFTLIPAELLFAPWSGLAPWTWPLLALALVAQAIRYWVIATLGRRWSVRVVTLPGAPRITGGPYRFLRHPNYAVVAAESLIFPLAFSCWMALAMVLPLNLVALARRIRIEDEALGQATAA